MTYLNFSASLDLGDYHHGGCFGRVFQDLQTHGPLDLDEMVGAGESNFCGGCFCFFYALFSPYVMGRGGCIPSISETTRCKKALRLCCLRAKEHFCHRILNEELKEALKAQNNFTFHC